MFLTILGDRLSPDMSRGNTEHTIAVQTEGVAESLLFL